jgi:hypothetical protein
LLERGEDLVDQGVGVGGAWLTSRRYRGFPRVLNAILVAKRVFEERDVDPLADEA